MSGVKRESRPGDTPYNGLKGEASPRKECLSRVQRNERVGISLVNLYERIIENLPFRSKGQKANAFHGCEKYASTAVKRDTNF